MAVRARYRWPLGVLATCALLAVGAGCGDRLAQPVPVGRGAPPSASPSPSCDPDGNAGDGLPEDGMPDTPGAGDAPAGTTPTGAAPAGTALPGQPTGSPTDPGMGDDPGAGDQTCPSGTELPTALPDTPTPAPSQTACPPDPSDMTIRAEASRLSGGKLPPTVSVSNRRCAGNYLVATLSSPRNGTVQVVLRSSGTTWTGVAVGSYLCNSPSLSSAPEARKLLGC